MLASLVGRSVEQLGDRFGPGGELALRLREAGKVSANNNNKITERIRDKMPSCLDAGAWTKEARNAVEDGMQQEAPRWLIALALGLLAALAEVLAAFVSDWCVHALEPAMQRLHISEVFAGLVIVAIAGNAVQNVVGVQLAAKNRSEYACSVVINSHLQIALVLARFW